jgi:hypothetical protein
MPPFRFFFLMRLPPLFELPSTHSRPSRLHLSHGGEPPEASLGKRLVYRGEDCRLCRSSVTGMSKTLTGRICSVLRQYNSPQHFITKETDLSLATEDACPRDSLHGRRRAILSHLELPSASNCRRRLRMRKKQDMGETEDNIRHRSPRARHYYCPRLSCY